MARGSTSTINPNELHPQQYRSLFLYQRDKHDSLLAMLSITVDDLLLSYKDYTVATEFYDQLSKAFDITTPTDTTKLKFLSLTIYQSPQGTSIDQTNHIVGKLVDHSLISSWHLTR